MAKICIKQNCHLEAEEDSNYCEDHQPGAALIPRKVKGRLARKKAKKKAAKKK